MSFPFLFRYDGALYMCPESLESGEIRVYRCTDFPQRWTHVATLMTGVPAVDTMLFEHEGRWWMMTCLDLRGWTTTWSCTCSGPTARCRANGSRTR